MWLHRCVWVQKEVRGWCQVSFSIDCHFLFPPSPLLPPPLLLFFFWAWSTLISFSNGENTESALKTTVTLLYASNKNMKEQITGTLPFMTASKLHLRNLIERVKDVKSLKKDIEEDTRIWKDFPMHIDWNRINTVEMATVPKAIFNEDLNSHATFHRNRKKKLKCTWEHRIPWITEQSWRKEKCWRIQVPISSHIIEP